jgi:putative addiction module antidote
MSYVEVKLRDVGNSKGIIIPKDVLEKMNIGEEGRLFLIPTRDGFDVKAFDPELQKQMDAAAKGMKKYRNALRTLADK